jgi:hypothetical protein
MSLVAAVTAVCLLLAWEFGRAWWDRRNGDE